MSSSFDIQVSSREMPVVTAADGQTVLPVNFPFQSQSELLVYQETVAGVRSVLTAPAGFTASGAMVSAGGNVTLTVPAVAGEKYRVVGAASIQRRSDITASGRYSTSILEHDLDKGIIIDAERARDIGRAMRAHPLDPALDYLPPPAARAGGALAFDPVTGAPIVAAILGALGFIASQDEAEAGTNNVKAMTPLRVFQAIRKVMGVAVELYGAKGDGVTNDTAAFVAALATGAVIQLRPGAIYLVNDGALVLSVSGSGIVGPGRELCEIKVSGTTSPGIRIADGLARVHVSGFRLSRVGTPGAGADGISAAAAILSQSTIASLHVLGHYDGVSLGVTDYSILDNVLSERNYRDGFRFQNVGTNGQVQWNLRGCFAQFNDGAGYIVKSGVQTGQITLGNWSDCGTFANTGRGVSFEGTASMPIQGARLNNCYVGDDNGGAGIYFDTYGTFHRVIGCFIELVGRGLSGRNYSTAATNLGAGIDATANNNALTVTETRIDSCSHDGIRSGARAFSAMGCDITDNGLSLTAARRNGIKLIAGTSYASIIGGTSGHRGAGASQQYAVEALSAAGTTVMGIAAMNLSAGLVAGALPNVIGNTIAAHFFISDGVVVGVPVGVNKGVGTINTAGDIYKNNAAYTNP